MLIVLIERNIFMSPTISTKKTKEKRRALKSRQSMEREKLIFYGVIIACGVTVFLHIIIQIVSAVKASSARKVELHALESQRSVLLLELEDAFQRELEIAKRAQQDNLAAQARAEEYERRLSLDSSFVKGKREETILKMRVVGNDKDISNKEALKKIAKLASPPRSGVGVYKDKKGYRVEVAFPYDWVIDSHSEYNNFLKGYYFEVRMTAAGIMKDIFSFGSSRGLRKLTVSCQSMMTIKSRDGKKSELRDLFTVTGTPGGRSWRRMSRLDVEKVWKKRNDQFPGMLKGY
jgi:hypothetical protein